MVRNKSKEAQERGRANRKNMSPAEALLWSALKSNALGFGVRRQFAAGPYFLDFYVPSSKLCIEVDGLDHLYRVERDAQRDAFLASIGIETIRFDAEQVFRDLQTVTRAISAKVAGQI